MIRIDVEKGADIPFDALYPIMKAAFQERAVQGLHFVCLSWTLDEFKEKLNNDTVLLARDVVKNKQIIGFERLIFLGDRLDCGLIAISPDYKRHGVGQLLFKTAEQLARKKNCKYMMADTAVVAKSSVKWHQKNGFKIIGLVSWESTNYYSYIFRKQIKYHPLWSNNVYCLIRRFFSTIECKSKYQANGDYTNIFKCYIKMLDKLSSLLPKLGLKL